MGKFYFPPRRSNFYVFIYEIRLYKTLLTIFFEMAMKRSKPGRKQVLTVCDIKNSSRL